MSDLYLIVGLGNPGRKYEQTRHNVGWHVLDELARRYQVRFDKIEKKAITATATIRGKRVLLAKPQTYMNASGEAVRGLVDFYKIDINRLIVMADDMDLPLGTLRLRESGSAGGQNGIKSIIRHLGTQDFSRVRFGIGRPPGRMDAAAYVLQTFHGDEAILAQEVASRAADAVETWLTEGITMAMSRFNGDIQEKAPPARTDPKQDLATYQRAHELNPADPDPLEKMAGVLRGLGRTDEAAQLHLDAAALFEKRGKTMQAISQLERAVSLNPALVAVQQRIAGLYEEAGNTKKAVQRYVTLADYLREQGDFAEAQAALAEALRINPQHPRALDIQHQLQQIE